MGYERFDVLTVPPHQWPSDMDTSSRTALRCWCADEGVVEDQARAIGTAGRWLPQVHLSDASHERWDRAPPGRASISFAAVGTALAETGFAGTSIVELISEDPDTAMADARSFLGAHG